MSARILLVGIVIVDAWPDCHSASLRLDCNVEIRETSTAARLDVIEIQKHRQYAYSLGSLQMEMNKIVMLRIVLAYLVL